jgi:hypothetical protein
LGDPERVGKPALGQTTLLARTPERLRKSPPLLGRCHVGPLFDVSSGYKHA